MRLLVRASLLLSLVLMLWTGQAGAHAYVEQSSPPDGAELQAAPQQVRVRFTEALETQLSSLRLFDARGQLVRGTAQRAEGDRVLVLDLPALPNGVYTLRWQVLSRDTHVTEDVITFAVGVPLPKATPADPVVIGAPAQPAPVSPAPPAQPAPSPPAQPAPAQPATPPAQTGAPAEPAPAAPAHAHDPKAAGGEAAAPPDAPAEAVPPAAEAPDARGAGPRIWLWLGAGALALLGLGAAVLSRARKDS